MTSDSIGSFNYTADNETKSLVQSRDNKPAWFEFLLHFLTLGVYTAIWFVRQAKLFKQLYNPSITPWLWLFAPLFIFAQPFALPRFIAYLHQLEEEAGRPKWNAWGNTWYFLVFVTTLLLDIGNRYELPGGMFVGAMLVWASLHTSLQSRFDLAKKASSRVEYIKSKYFISMGELALVMIMLPIGAYTYYTDLSGYFSTNTIETLSADINYKK